MRLHHVIVRYYGGATPRMAGYASRQDADAAIQVAARDLGYIGIIVREGTLSEPMATVASALGWNLA